jgi:hypothetical protein
MAAGNIQSRAALLFPVKEAAPDRDEPPVCEINVAPRNFCSLTFSAPGEREETHKVRAIARTPCACRLDLCDELSELVPTRQSQPFRPHAHALQLCGRIVEPRAGFNCVGEDM